METTLRPQTSLLTTKRGSFTVDTVVWATPSPTRSSEMATPTTSKTAWRALGKWREGPPELTELSGKKVGGLCFKAFWISLATSTSSLLPINLRRRCCNEGLYSRVRVCLRTIPKRFALSWILTGRSTSCSNAASEACGSKIAAGWARSWWKTPKAESTVPASCFWHNKTNSFFLVSNGIRGGLLRTSKI